MRRRRWILLGLVAMTLVWANCSFRVPPRSGPAPVAIGDGWRTESPAASGFDEAALHQTLKTAMDGPFNLHSILVERQGRLVAEQYQSGRDRSVYGLFSRPHDFGPTVRHDLRSIGKSVTSLLFGIALQKGLIGKVSTPVLDLYPELSDLATPEKKAITLEHLLTMSSGLAWHEGEGLINDEFHLIWKNTPSRFVLKHPMATSPGSAFNYNGGGTTILADLISRATGKPFKEFARTELFEPLGIQDWEWVADVHGRAMPFNGLRMRPRDLAKIGRLVLDQGRWQGRQLVAEAWIRASLQPRLATGVADFRYGYQWWAGTVTWQGRTLPWNAGFGNGGQRLFLVPDLDLVVVTTAGAYGQLTTARRVNQLLQEIVTAVQPSSASLG